MIPKVTVFFRCRLIVTRKSHGEHGVSAPKAMARRIRTFRNVRAALQGNFLSYLQVSQKFLCFLREILRVLWGERQRVERCMSKNVWSLQKNELVISRLCQLGYFLLMSHSSLKPGLKLHCAYWHICHFLPFCVLVKILLLWGSSVQR